MSKFFTADWHLCSESVFELGHRPFKNVDRMNSVFIKSANQKASKKDIIYHVGDFYNCNTNKKSECYRLKANYFLDKINATMIMIEGNHDINNNVKSTAQLLFTKIGNYDVSIGHYPSYFEYYPKSIINKIDEDEESTIQIPKCYQNIGTNHIHICGHVHNTWKYTFDKKRNILNINVGVDVWKYNIVSETHLIRYIDSIIYKENNYKMCDFLH